MSTTGRPVDGVDGAERAAARIREAGFVRVVSHADGASLAAAGVLARALDDVPFQVSVASTDVAAASTFANTADDTVRVSFGFDADALAVRDAAATPDVAARTATDDGGCVRLAASIARELGTAPDAPLVLAGLRAGGVVPTADDAEYERRPGVGIPTADLGDGLAHSTLLHGDFSGDVNRAGATLAALDLPADLDSTAHRRFASHVAIEATSGPNPERTTDALHRVLHPHVHADCAYATIEGFGDVLDTLARTAPGLGVAAAIGGIDRAVALDEWRDASAAVHTAVARATAHVPTERGAAAQAGVHVATVSVDGTDPVAVARILRDFVTDAPAVLVTGDDGAALATTEADAHETLASADADATGGTARLAYGSVAPVDGDADSTAAELDALAARVRGLL